MRGFRFASTQPRLELMNKSNEWHVIIGQRERDGQRVGAGGRKTWNYLSGKICKLSRSSYTLCFSYRGSTALRLGPAAHVHGRESDHTHAQGSAVCIFERAPLAAMLWKKKRKKKKQELSYGEANHVLPFLFFLSQSNELLWCVILNYMNHCDVMNLICMQNYTSLSNLSVEYPARR